MKQIIHLRHSLFLSVEEALVELLKNSIIPQEISCSKCDEKMTTIIYSEKNNKRIIKIMKNTYFITTLFLL